MHKYFAKFTAAERRTAMNRQEGFSNIELLIIAVIVVILAGLVVITFSGVRQKSRDTNRKDAITTIQEQVESFQAQTGNYPSFSQLNSSAFRSADLKNLSESDLKDPKWSPTSSSCTKAGAPQLQPTVAPGFGCYGYAVSPADCDNVAIACASYTLTANLEAGGTYVKKSLD